MNSRIRSCFIAAPAGSNLEVLLDVLRQRGIRVVAPPNDFGFGRELGSEITDRLASVDLVIGVLTRERRSEWTLFELGIAWGGGKLVLLFAPPNSSHLPSTLRRFVIVRANISNREAVQFAIDQLLAAPETPYQPSRVQEKARPLGPSAYAYRQSSIDLTTSLKGVELEQLVANALSEAGVEVVATAPGQTGADLAIWYDALQTTVGNPLLVEISTRLTHRAAVEAAQRLARQAAAAGGVWGLLLYGLGPETLRGLPPNVLALPIAVLFDRLQNQSFDEIVRDLRNRRVHGSDLA